MNSHSRRRGTAVRRQYYWPPPSPRSPVSLLTSPPPPWRIEAPSWSSRNTSTATRAPLHYERPVRELLRARGHYAGQVPSGGCIGPIRGNLLCLYPALDSKAAAKCLRVCGVELSARLRNGRELSARRPRTACAYAAAAAAAAGGSQAAGVLLWDYGRAAADAVAAAGG